MQLRLRYAGVLDRRHAIRVSLSRPGTAFMPRTTVNQVLAISCKAMKSTLLAHSSHETGLPFPYSARRRRMRCTISTAIHASSSSMPNGSVNSISQPITPMV